METTVPEVARHDTRLATIDQPAAPTEAEPDRLVTDIKFLNTELATTEKHLRVALVATLREHAQLLDLFAAQEQATVVFERGEPALAQAVFMAQHRVANQAAKAELLGRGPVFGAGATLVLERGESALAQAVLIAQLRVANQAAKAELLGRLRQQERAVFD
jgi:hypothetical protein